MAFRQKKKKNEKDYLIDSFGIRVDANMKVADLIDANLGCWKNNLVDSCLLPFDATRIKAVKY